jgi:hypothetical protein
MRIDPDYDIFDDDGTPQPRVGSGVVVVIAVFAILILLGAICGVASGGEILVSGITYNAKPNDTKDDTAGLQGAFDAANGDVIVIRRGTYLVSKTLTLSAAKSWSIAAEPGAVFEWRGDEAGPLLLVSSPADTDTTKRITGLTLLGPQLKVAPAKHGTLLGLQLRFAHSTVLDDLRIIGFSGAGLDLYHSYRCEVRSLDVRFNGTGVRCSGANATAFTNLCAMYNRVGYQNIQSLVCANIEGNVEDGARFTEVGMRYSVHDAWFEQNAQVSGGYADISANSRSDLSKAPWNPVVLTIGGCTTFHNAYSLERAHLAYTLAGCMHLSTSGAIRLFDRNFHMHPWSTIRDGASGNGMIDEALPGPGFDGPVWYERRELKLIGTDL